MTYEIYRYIFIGGAVLAGIMFLISLLLFFMLRIPTVIGYFTGANERKAIENIRNHNASTDDNGNISQINRERGKLTDKINSSGRIEHNPSTPLYGALNTEKINSETTALSYDNKANETTVLDIAANSSEFVIEYEITYINTSEIIT